MIYTQQYRRYGGHLQSGAGNCGDELLEEAQALFIVLLRQGQRCIHTYKSTLGSGIDLLRRPTHKSCLTCHVSRNVLQSDFQAFNARGGGVADSLKQRVADQHSRRKVDAVGRQHSVFLSLRDRIFSENLGVNLVVLFTKFGKVKKTLEGLKEGLDGSIKFAYPQDLIALNKLLHLLKMPVDVFLTRLDQYILGCSIHGECVVNFIIKVTYTHCVLRWNAERRVLLSSRSAQIRICLLVKVFYIRHFK